MKRLAAGGLLAIVVAGLAVLVLVRRTGGPLDESGNGFGGPQQAAKPFTAFYELRNDGGRKIEIQKVSLGEHSPWAALPGRASRDGRSTLGRPMAGLSPD